MMIIVFIMGARVLHRKIGKRKEREKREKRIHMISS